jgi:hypothetical protein
MYSWALSKKVEAPAARVVLPTILPEEEEQYAEEEEYRVQDIAFNEMQNYGDVFEEGEFDSEEKQTRQKLNLISNVFDYHMTKYKSSKQVVLNEISSYHDKSLLDDSLSEIGIVIAILFIKERKKQILGERYDWIQEPRQKDKALLYDIIEDVKAESRPRIVDIIRYIRKINKIMVANAI